MMSCDQRRCGRETRWRKRKAGGSRKRRGFPLQGANNANINNFDKGFGIDDLFDQDGNEGLDNVRPGGVVEMIANLVENQLDSLCPIRPYSC